MGDKIKEMSFDERCGSYIIEIKGIIFESDEPYDPECIDHLTKIADHYYSSLDAIIDFMLPDLESIYGIIERESIKEKLGKPTINQDNGIVQYLEQTFDDFHIFEFEFIDDEFKELHYFSIDG